MMKEGDFLSNVNVSDFGYILWSETRKEFIKRKLLWTFSTCGFITKSPLRKGDGSVCR